MKKCPAGKVLSPKGRCVKVDGPTARKYGLDVLLYDGPMIPKTWKTFTTLTDARVLVKSSFGSINAVGPNIYEFLDGVVVAWINKILKEKNKDDITLEQAVKNLTFGVGNRLLVETDQHIVSSEKLKEVYNLNNSEANELNKYITSITISMLNVVDKKKKLTEYDFVRAMEKEEDLFFGVSEIVSY
jgi:hypothetical protein